MADFVPITPGTGANIESDAITDAGSPGIAGVTRYHQRVKMETGPDGAARDVSLHDPVPVASQSIEEKLDDILSMLRVIAEILAQDARPLVDIDSLLNKEHV